MKSKFWPESSSRPSTRTPPALAIAAAQHRARPSTPTLPAHTQQPRRRRGPAGHSAAAQRQPAQRARPSTRSTPRADAQQPPRADDRWPPPVIPHLAPPPLLFPARFPCHGDATGFPFDRAIFEREITIALATTPHPPNPSLANTGALHVSG
ncbi:hypothetical protein BDA96_03G111500 [Sorghum bicolor]|uniref:Uncharacterized protein n=1 Tax=Sorghum bicolor TaxID=4558 RepID=A0A921RBT7_SORBI|nr:hypothetical protein BDA96_03G111500 [Sorghum bicolor]